MSGLKEFREAVKREAERTPAPSMRSILARDGRARVRWQWVVAAAMLLMLGAFTLSSRRQERLRMEQDRADAELMRQVDEALARSVPQAMSVLWEGGR